MIPFNRSVFHWQDGLDLLHSFVSKRYELRVLSSIKMLDIHNLLFTSSCRSALYLAYRALNLKGKVIVSPLTCDDAIIPIVAAGLRPEFADICPLTFNVCPVSVRRKIDKETAAIQAIYLGGNPSGASTLRSIALENNLVFIEDCAHSLGARDQGRWVGTGDVGCFNFTKSLDGAGGALVGCERILEKATAIQREWHYTPRPLIGYRITRSLLSGSSSALFNKYVYDFLMRLVGKFTRNRPDPEAGQVDKKMSRPRLMEMYWSAHQIPKLNGVIIARKSAADLLTSILRARVHGIQLQVHFNGAEGVYTRYYIRVPGKTWQVNQMLQKHGVDAKHLRQKYGALYQERFERAAWLRPYIQIAELPNYQTVHDNLIALPLYAGLSKADAQKIADALVISLGTSYDPDFGGLQSVCSECEDAPNAGDYTRYFL